MRTTRRAVKPIADRFHFQAIAILFLTLALGLGHPSLAQDPDYVGVFWDTDYSQNSLTIDEYPGLVTGYLVLQNPPSENGLVAWECCIDVDGPVQVLSYTLQGNAINAETEPCFAVAIGQAPLPSTGAVLLASFQMMVNEPLPVIISLNPLYNPSLPGQMSYIMADDPGELLPMVTLTGEPVVAWVNGHIPNVQVDPQTLHFEDTPIGSTAVRTVTVSNQGTLPAYLDIALTGDCDQFSLPGLSGLVTVPPFETRSIEVAFSPVSTDFIFCNLTLSEELAEVQMVGSGTPLILSWEAPTEVDFGTVFVGYGEYRPVTITNTGQVPILIEPSIEECEPDFIISTGNFSSPLAPGHQRTIYLRFQPTAPGSYSCFLELGDIVPAVHLIGEGTALNVQWDAPTSHDFGPVGVGYSITWTFTVSNTGNVPFQVNPYVLDGSENFELDSGGPTTLQPGSSRTINLEFHPLTPGPHTGSLHMGSTIPIITLQGEGVPRPAGWTVQPDSLDFGVVYLGSLRSSNIQIHNSGGTFLDLDVSLDDPNLGFSVSHGAGSYQLAPGSTQAVVVLFQPQVEGFFETFLNLGPELVPVPVMGIAEYIENVCLVQPDSLVFGPLNVGDVQAQNFSVTNNGTEPLEISPYCGSDVFLIDGLNRTLYSGESAQFVVLFQPLSPGTFTGTIELGDQLCAPVHLTGTAYSGGGGNLVGIFFDEEYSYIEAQTSVPNEVLEGYLVLVDPSETSGVNAWELAVGIDGDAQWLNWELEGQHLNIGQDGEFIVAMGGDPLPYSPAVLLATFEILVALPFPNSVNLELGPIQNPSVPGQMVWAPGHDPSLLIPMQPFTGNSVVAYINGNVVGIGRPAPLAILTGGSVELEWTTPIDLGDGCHLYRRDETGADVRLTDQPLTGFGSTLYFIDRPTGYASGTVLYYSYTVVSGTSESDRSQETEIRITGLPQVLTRLLPNVPNPFNPQTEIRFELERSQQARVAVYDVTGRLVKTLAVGQLDGGSHVRVWRGRDSAGRRVPSGAYYIRLVTESRVDHQKIMLLK